MKTIVLTGGGTAGHIIPNLALVPILKEYFDKIYYLGSQNGMEKEIVSKEKNVIFMSIETVKFIRKFTFKNFLIPFKLLRSIRKTKKMLKQLSPDIIFSKGGFVSVPVCIAGKKLGIPVVSHESDITLGLANKLIYHYADKMLTSFSLTAKKRKTIHTGSPIRQQILNGKKHNILANYKISPAKQSLLIFGGSLGAKQINNLIFNSIDELLVNNNIFHIVGKGNINENLADKEYYHQLEFVDNIEDFYAFSDMTITRAGANTLFELLALKKPNILIPLSKSQSRGDQIENAMYFSEKGYSCLLEEENTNSKTLLKAIEHVSNNKMNYIKAMEQANQTLSNQRIVDIIVKQSIFKTKI